MFFSVRRSIVNTRYISVWLTPLSAPGNNKLKVYRCLDFIFLNKFRLRCGKFIVKPIPVKWI